MADLNFKLVIDTKPLVILESKLNAILKALNKPFHIDIDSSNAESQIADLEGEMEGISDVETTISADASEAVSGAEEAKESVDEIPDKKNFFINFNSEQLLGQLAQVGLALSGMIQVYSMVANKIGGLVTASNQQEIAEQDLINSLKQKNLYSKEYYQNLIQVAVKTQELTNVGDEQSMMLITLATNMGVASEKMQESLQGSIGLAKMYEKVGLSQETALKGIALAYEGNYTQLQRYIPALRTAETEAEKMAILQKAMADGFEMTKEQAKSGVGTYEKLSAQLGDIQEKFGDVLKTALRPFVSVLGNAIELMNKHPELTKAMVAGLMALGVALVAIKIKQIALNTALAIGAALSGNWGALALAAAVGVGTWALSSEDLGDAQEELNAKLTEGTEQLKDYNKEVKEFNKNTLEADKQKNLEEILRLEKLINKAQDEKRRMKYDSTQDIYIPAKNREISDLIAKRKALEKQNQEIEKQISEHNKNKQEAEEIFNEWKKNEDQLALMNDIELAKHKLSEAKKEYDAIAELDEEKLERKKELYSQILQLENDISEREKARNQIEEARKEQERIANEAKEKQRIVSLTALENEFSLAKIDNELERIKKSLEIERDAKLQEAMNLNASEETLSNIRETYRQKEIDAVRNHNHEIARETRSKNAKLRQQEEDFFEFKQMQLAKEDPLQAQLNSQLRAINRYFERKHESLIANGMTEEEIERTKAQAIARVTEVISKQKTQKQEAEFQKGIKNTRNFFGNLATVANSFGKSGFKTWKALAMAQATVDTFASANAAYKSLAGISPVLAAAAAAAAIASGLINVKRIEKTKYQKAETGGHAGLLAGPSHANGGVVLELEGDEYITRKQRVRELGVGFFDFINNAPLSAIKERLQGFNVPSISISPVPSVPRFAYATGGSVSGGSGLMEKLIERVDNLTRELKNKEMSAVVSLDPDDVVGRATDTLINDKSESGSKKKARW